MYFQNNIQEHLSGLNDQQRDAVLCRSRIVYVSAGPGSGKTHMLTSKLVDYIVSSTTPQRIVALSYTNTAARQIGERFRKKATGITTKYSFYNGTIHSFCYRMMMLYASSDPSSAPFDYTILDDEELSELANDISAVVLMAPAAVLRDDAIRGSTMGKQYNPLDPPEFVELWGNIKLGRNYIKTAFTLPIYETAARYHGPACIIHGTGDRVVPYTYGIRYHQQWLGSEYHELETYDHGFSQNIYMACELASDFLIKVLK